MKIMQMRRGMGASGGGDLRYQTHKYIIATNIYSYINTGYVPTPSTLLDMYVECKQGSEGFVLGCRKQLAVPGRKSYAMVWAINSNVWFYRVDRNDFVSLPQSGTSYPSIFVRAQILSNNAIIGERNVDIPILAESSGLPMFLFTLNQNGQPQNAIQDCKIGKTKLYTSTDVHRYFVPATLLSNTNMTWDGNTHYAGEVGMVDEQNDIFYSSEDPRGDFVAGDF